MASLECLTREKCETLSTNLNQSIRYAILVACLVTFSALVALGYEKGSGVERMRVIVSFDISAFEANAEDDQRRDTTIGYRNRLLSTFADGEVKLIRTLELSGQVVLEINADLLKTLQKSPEVKAVSIERIYSTQRQE